MQLIKFSIWEQKKLSLDKKINILFTKLPDEEILIRAKDHQLIIDHKEFIATQCNNADLSKVHNELVFTSANAVTCVSERVSNDWWNNKKIYCLEGKTAKALRSHNIIGTASNATDLAKFISNHQVKEVSFCCSNIRREELPALLSAHGITVDCVVVYQTSAVHHDIEQLYDAYAFFSPSAVQSFFATNSLPDSAICFAIGNTTKESIKEFTNQPIKIAKQPTQSSLLDEMIATFNIASKIL